MAVRKCGCCAPCDAQTQRGFAALAGKAAQPVGFAEPQGHAINGGRLFQKAKLSLIERNSLQPFRILRFRRSHHATVLKNKVQGQNVLFEVAHSQNGRSRTQLPCQRAHHLPEELIQFWHGRERIKTPKKGLRWLLPARLRAPGRLSSLSMARAVCLACSASLAISSAKVAC
jgi:hypothetical protein